LKGLSLWRAPILINEIEPELDNELINMDMLPPTLQYLLIDGLPILSIDIVSALQTLKNLRCLRYYRSIIPNRRFNEFVGFNRLALSELLKHPLLLKAIVNTATERDCYALTNPEFTCLAVNRGWKDITVYESWHGCLRLVLRRI